MITFKSLVILQSKTKTISKNGQTLNKSKGTVLRRSDLLMVSFGDLVMMEIYIKSESRTLVTKMS